MAMPLLAALALALSAPQDAWTRAEMSADLEQLVAAVRERWAYLDDRREHSGVDLDALHRASLAALDEVRSREEFARVLRRFVAGLQDGHGGVSFADDALPAHYLLLELVRCPEGVVVASVGGQDVLVDPDARAPARGELLVALDGRPVEELLREREALTCASTPGQRAAKALADLRVASAPEVELELEDVAGARRRVRVRTRAWPLMPTRDNWGLSWPVEDVALLCVDSFAVRDWAAWLAAPHDEREPFLVATYERIAEITAELAARPARALIIDVRGNGGGTDTLGIRLAEHLLPGRFHYFELSALRDGAWSPPGSLVHGTRERQVFEGRVVALTDERCFSVTDNFLRCLSDLHPRFTVVGRPTGGGTGAPRVIAQLAHSDAHIRLCTMRVYGPDRGLIEGRGTTPDVAVTWTRADVLARRDPDLVAALRALEE